MELTFQNLDLVMGGAKETPIVFRYSTLLQFEPWLFVVPVAVS